MAYRHHRHCNHHEDNSGMGCLVMLVLGILAMPIVGVFMLCGKDETQKTIGAILVIVGLIFWIMMAVQG